MPDLYFDPAECIEGPAPSRVAPSVDDPVPLELQRSLGVPAAGGGVVESFAGARPAGELTVLVVRRQW